MFVMFDSLNILTQRFVEFMWRLSILVKLMQREVAIKRIENQFFNVAQSVQPNKIVREQEYKSEPILGL